ncbi:MAG TPA: LamG-like jellyroll fold domain-containing protein [Candidatus Paceibacterota bacterium]|jgi:Tfp pilus assembly protein PilE|nr:LamG-like jellyroll fold domain-containing protein [Candidatus Paceibacterota bacterium]
MRRYRRGFTLIELLVFVALFSVAIIGLITIFVTITRVQSHETSANEVETQGQFLLQQLQYYIQTARLVDMVEDAKMSSLKLREATSSIDPTVLSVSSGTLYLTQGVNGTPQALTSNKVTVSNIAFTRHYNQSASSSPFGADSVSYSFTLAASTTNATLEYSQSFESGATVFTPVPKIALIQQSATSTGSGSSISTAFPSANTKGNLLIAVISNTGSSGTSISVADTAGNTWYEAVNPSYAAYNQQFAIFYAANATSTSAETVTATFGTSVTSPSLFIYEYRGAATSTPFDASSSLTTASTTSISSGSASPTSTEELLFGVGYFNPASGSILPGSGFTLETSSTVSNTYVEDQNAYVTGPEAATWSYSGSSPPTTSSSAAIITFIGGSNESSYTPWTYYRALTVTSSAAVASGTNSNFPMLVSSVVSSWASSAHGGTIQNLCTAPNGSQEPCDLAFATSASNCQGGNYLNFETEAYNSSTGALVDWVNVPTMATGTVIYTCYDSGVAYDLSNPAGTWNSNYLEVAHLADDASSTTVVESTANDLTGKSTSSTNQISVPGPFGATALSFSTSGISFATTSLLNFTTSSFSTELWEDTQTIGNYNTFLGPGAYCTGGWYEQWKGGTNQVQFYVCSAGGAYVTGGTLATGTWKDLVFTRNGINWAWYINGALSSSGTNFSNPTSEPNVQNHLGMNNGGNGYLAEMRVASGALSSQWILTQYNNESSPSTFYAIGSQTSF